jgi:hypothetical protein
MRRCDLGEFGVELRAFFVVVFDALSAVSAEGVFVEWVDVDRVANVVDAVNIFMEEEGM